MKRIKALAKRGFDNNRQFIIYSVIGLTSVVLDFSIFFILSQILGVNYLIANIISSLVGISNSFLWNTLFNFKISDFFWHRFLCFYAVGLAGLALSSGLLYVFIGLLGLPAVIVKFGSLVIIVIVQFNLNKYLTFREQWFFKNSQNE